MDNLPIGVPVFIRAYLIQEGTVSYGNLLSIITIPANVWVERKAFPGGFRWSDSAAFVIDHKGYIGTGYKEGERNEFWRYDPIFDSWGSIANFKGRPRKRAIGMTIAGKGYITTGSVSRGSIADLWLYDPLADDWFRRPNFPGGIMDDGVGFALNNKGYVIGQNDNRLYAYDPASESWDTLCVFEEHSRRKGAAAFTHHGIAYLTGGSRFGFFEDVWAYHADSIRWSPKKNFPGEARFQAIGLSTDEKAYVGMGDSDFSKGLKDFWEYNLEGDFWSEKAEFPSNFPSVMGFSIGRRVYVQALDGSFWVYIPE